MTAQVQHYIPQFVLRRFRENHHNHVFVFDKHSNRSFEANPAKIAAVKSYYDFQFQGRSRSIEPFLTDLEHKAAQQITQIVVDSRLDLLNQPGREELAAFFAVQMVRTPAIEKEHAEMAGRMETWLRENGMPDSFFELEPGLGDELNAERVMMARNILRAPENFSGAFLQKDWVLLETSSQTPFLIGDHPLTLHNVISAGPRGNLGLKVEGIEIYFPLSPTLTLGIYCPSHRRSITEGLKKLDFLAKQNSELNNGFAKARSEASILLNAMSSGAPLRINPAQVEFHNSLQISTAERFVFSSTDDFALAKSMIEEHPHLRHGRRLQEGTGKF